MTAIFMVWNNNGLALAADQSVTLTNENDDGTEDVVYADITPKILKNSNHNFAVASSGLSRVNRISINGILSQWLDSLDSKESMEECVFDFINWLSDSANLDEIINDFRHSKSRMDILLKLFKDNFPEKTKEGKIEKYEQFDSVEEYIDYFFSEMENYDSVNTLSFDEDYHNIEEKDRLELPLLCSLIDRIDSRSFSNEKLMKIDQQAESIFQESFRNVFEIEANEDNPWHQYLRQKAKHHLIHFVDNDADYAEIMFCGYGRKDWLPSCYVLKLYNYDLGIPSLLLLSAYTVEQIWYQAIGQHAAVRKFWAPIDSKVQKELIERISDKYSHLSDIEDIADEIDEILDDHSDDLLALMREKIQYFSVKKLSYIAKQMVALEAFRSFIQEYLPTVGGEIDCLTISRENQENIAE